MTTYYNYEITTGARNRFREFCRDNLQPQIDANHYVNALIDYTDFSTGPDYDHSIEISGLDTITGHPHYFYFHDDEIEWTEVIE